MKGGAIRVGSHALLVPLEEETRESALPREDAMQRRQSESWEERPHQGTRLAGTLILDLPALEL